MNCGRTAHPAVDLPGLAVQVVGDGPAIGWIHGYTMSSAVFEEIWPRLTGYRHVGIDLPGHGRSPSWPVQARLSEIAAAVACVLEREEVQALVAVSMGTMVAFEMVIRRLYPLSKLVVVAPALVGMPPGAGTAPGATGAPPAVTGAGRRRG